MSDSTFVGHEPCPKCGSKDNLARYSDGHGVCFSHGCDHYEHAGSASREGSAPARQSSAPSKLMDGDYESLPIRKISAETCRFMDYRVNQDRGVQLATYYDKDGRPCAQKVRDANKQFRFIGDGKSATLFGQQKWRAGGKRLVITEGEIDALSVAEVNGCKWPVVSVPHGATGAAKALAKQMEWLDSFEKIILFFDQDEPGRAAAIECAELFAPGKAAIVNFHRKDANEALQHGEAKRIEQATWDAKPYWPDDLVEGGTENLWERVRDFKIATDFQYPWQGLNDKLFGMRRRELVLWTAGSGIGKSHALRELSLHLLPELRARGSKLGIVALEESVEISALRLACMHLGVSHTTWAEIPEEERHKAVLDVTNGIVLYDHFGSLDSERLLSKVRAMVTAGCEVVILDHISIVISGSEEANQNERRAIDVLMTNLRSLVEEKEISMHVISHLRKPKGASHERGGEITLDDLRGSGSLKQLSDAVIALERDQQAKTEGERNLATVRVLKNRWTGLTGIATYLKYDATTTRFTEIFDNPFAEEDEECAPDGSSSPAGF